MSIKIFKSKKILTYTHQTENFKYPIGIGENEQGHKQLRGDLKTPEGAYKVCVKNSKSKFHLSLGLNYPSITDAQCALDNKVISREEFNSIKNAHESHGGSDWSTSMGGAIYIHGGLEDKAYSEGCIRMYNKDIEQLYSLIELGDSVTIYK